MVKPSHRSTSASNPNANVRRWLPWILAIGGTIALAASIALSVEVFDRLKDPSFTPVCNLNPIFSCTSVADSAQSHAFGIPNYFIGIAGYAGVVAVALALLGGAQFKRWLWLVINAGLLVATIFLHWLIFETLYRIGALCIFCMVVWATTIPMFWYTLLYSLQESHLEPPAALKSTAGFLRRHHADILLVWFLLIAALVTKRFWYYWSGLF
jgi:uncharacterized membrane protein